VQGQEIVVVGSVTKRNDAEFINAVNHLREARAVAKTGEELFEQAKANVLEIVGSKPGIYEAPGVGRINFAERAGRTSLDTKALAAARPIDRMKLFTVLSQYNEYSAAETLGHEDIDLDLSEYEKTGKPFHDFRFYGSREE
jgi:hypothetical protein